MTLMEDLTRREIKELLYKCWMTHDAMWFAHTLLTHGIDEANRLKIENHYQCGVLYRIQCWLTYLDILFEMTPSPQTCLMVEQGDCRGRVTCKFIQTGMEPDFCLGELYGSF